VEALAMTLSDIIGTSYRSTCRNSSSFHAAFPSWINLYWISNSLVYYQTRL